jgi:hypothetical protein
LGITALGYVVVLATDPAKWQAVACDVLGMMPGAERADGALALRLDDRPFRILVEKAGADRFGCIGLECANGAIWEELLARVAATGTAVTHCDAATAKARCVGALARFNLNADHLLPMARETAAMFRAENGKITPVATLLSLTDRSIGGVYETVTRHLGFGSHGQGSVMALAALGSPAYDLSPWLSAKSWTDVSIHETGVVEAFPSLARTYDEPIRDEHRDLAASVQHALEQTLLTLAIAATGGSVDALCFAGGVALNCKANDLLRTSLGAAAVGAGFRAAPQRE